MLNILLPEGVKIGHCDNDNTGVTVILSPKGCVAGVDVRGGAPGTRETDLLNPYKAISELHAVVLSGGSAYGLETSCGVMKWLYENNFGYKIGDTIVPLVSSAVIFDLISGKPVYPDMDMGYRACENAVNGNIKFGGVGVGKGATIGKIRGVEHSSKGGVGAATVNCGGAIVTAIMAVNAFGDVYDHNTGKIIAGAKDNNGNFLDVRQCVLSGNFAKLFMGANTTIGAVITDARLTKLQANKLAQISHNGLAQSIKPVHTDYDGDTLFAMSAGTVEADFTMLSIAAVEAVSQAITNAVV